MPINPNIAMSYRGVEMPQQNALADYAAIQQIQSGQRQAEVSQMQLESMRRDQAALAKMQEAITAKGGPSDLNVAADEMIKSGIPEYFKQGLTIKQTLDKQKRFASLLGPTGGAAAAPTAAPASEAYPGYNESIGMAAPAPAAPVNAMAVPAAAAAPSVNAMNLTDMRSKINQAYAIGTPEALAWAKAREEEMKPMVVSPGASVFQGGKFGAVAPAQRPTKVEEYNFAKSTEGGGFTGSYADFIKMEKAAGAARTDIKMPPQQSAFEGELGKGQAKSIIDSRAAAQDAVSIIDTVETGRGLLKSGMITGAGADFMVNLNQALKTAGVDFGYADAAANSQAYAANMAQNVGKIIKQFGAGTGLSDADRQYAEKMAAGKITLDAKALNKILDINERGARNVITRHNKDVEGIKTNIPLKVEVPVKRAEPATAATAPPVAIEYLRANPSMKNAFDAKYGAGAADRALKGQ